MIGALLVVGALSSAVAAEPKFVLEKGPLSPVGTDRERFVPPPDTPNLQYPLVVYRGAAQMGMSRAFVGHVRDGLDMLYHRHYRDMRTLFGELEAAYPDTGVMAVSDSLMWQSMMFENYDFRYDASYTASSALARKRLGDALAKPGNDAWEHLMLGVVAGIEAIHAARQDHYLPALSLAFEAVDNIEATRRSAPNFVDLALADGLYNYWRTAITLHNKALPDFGDKRAEGITQMQTVIDKGVFLTAPARLSLAYSYLDGGKYMDAAALLQENAKLYPDNVINQMLLGTTFLYARKYPDALTAFDRVLAIDPTNRRVIYYRGIALHRLGRLEEALTYFKTYLASPDLETYQRSATQWRMGEVLFQLKRYDEAEVEWTASAKLGDDNAKASLERLHKARKEGTLK